MKFLYVFFYLLKKIINYIEFLYIKIYIILLVVIFSIKLIISNFTFILYKNLMIKYYFFLTLHLFHLLFLKLI